MVAELMINNEMIIEDDGVDIFIHFLHAIWKAQEGDVELVDCFNAIQLDLRLNPMALFGLLMSRKPLTVDQALILKRIIELGGK